MTEITEAQEKFGERQGLIRPESQPITTPKQVQTSPPDQEQTQIPTPAPEKGRPFGFLDFFKRMKGQKTTPPPSGSQPYRRPDGEFGLKVNSDNVPDPINSNTISNPEYDADLADPNKISPINESVASGGRLPTEPTNNNQ